MDERRGRRRMVKKGNKEGGRRWWVTEGRKEGREVTERRKE